MDYQKLIEEMRENRIPSKDIIIEAVQNASNTIISRIEKADVINSDMIDVIKTVCCLSDVNCHDIAIYDARFCQFAWNAFCSNEFYKTIEDLNVPISDKLIETVLESVLKFPEYEGANIHRAYTKIFEVSHYLIQNGYVTVIDEGEYEGELCLTSLGKKVNSDSATPDSDINV